jgi:diaminopimelate decarboxylase
LTIGGVGVDKLIEKYSSPLYVYDKNIIINRFKELESSVTYTKKKLLFACKANSNFEIMKLLCEIGSGIDAVSPGEVLLALEAGFKPSDILFTGDNCTLDEIKFCVEKKVLVNIGSLFHLEKYGKMFPKTRVSVRINPDVGDGHHGHTITGGPHTKFGIYHTEISEIESIAEKYSLEITGMHCHIGSGILNSDKYMEAVEIMLLCAKKFTHLEFVDFGGGIGIPYRENDKSIDLADFGRKISKRFSDFCKERKEELYMFLEPGRFIVAEAGYLLAEVNNIKTTPAHKFVGVNTGFNHLIRPMAYGSYHRIVNATNLKGKYEKVVVAGNLCESGDVFTQGEGGIEDREISEIRDGDIIAILSSGAYGYSMASRYNARLLPAEVMVDNGKDYLIRKRDCYDDIINAAKNI